MRRNVRSLNGDSMTDMPGQSATVHDFMEEQQRRRGGGEAAEVRQLAFTDVGNGQRFAKQHGENVRYVEELGKQKWLIWTEGNENSKFENPDSQFITGGYWRMDRTGEVMRLAKATGESIRDEQAAADSSNNFVEERGKHYFKTQERKSLVSMLALAQSEPPIPATPEDFDRDPLLLNCQNGTLALREGKPEFRRAARSDMLTKRIPVHYHPDAKAETWIQMVKRWMGHKEASEIKDDAERATAIEAVNSLCGFLARAVGLSLTGVINDRAVFILHGTGANGKTIFIETIRSLFGADFSTVMPVEALLSGKLTSSIPTDIADLRGKRFAIASETNENDKLSLAKLKRLSGGDMLTGRQLYGQKFDFHPTHHLWLATNHKPSMRGATKAVFDRIKLVPFKVRIPESEQVPSEQLKALLRDELPGILNWALDGFRDWWENGLSVPVEVSEATSSWERADDLVLHFLDEMTERKEGATETKGTMYNAWVSYCKERNEFHGSATRFSQWMAEHEIEDGRTGRGRFWKNIRLVENASGLPSLVQQSLVESRAKAESGELDF
jgi:putative DNA primase/helicase